MIRRKVYRDIASTVPKSLLMAWDTDPRLP